MNSSKIYQDQWIKGRLAVRGHRECANRYEIIKSFCTRFEGPFSICDIGANMLYFSLRLTEDFPKCRVMAFEFNSFDLRLQHLRKNDAQHIMLINRKLTVNDLYLLAAMCHFDVILMLSMFHHLSEPFEAWLSALRSLGSNIIMEFAVNDMRADKRFNSIPADAVMLGTGEGRPDKNMRRPIVVIPGRNGLLNERITSN